MIVSDRWVEISGELMCNDKVLMIFGEGSCASGVARWSQQVWGRRGSVYEMVGIK